MLERASRSDRNARDMAATKISAPARIERVGFPRDLKVFAFLAAFWALAMLAQIVIHDLTISIEPLEAVALGMRFEGFAARVAMAAQAMAIATMAIGLLSERKWGLWLAILYMLEASLSRLVFMTSYLDDFSEARNVRISGMMGIGSVLIFLYLCIRARDVLSDDGSRS